MKDSRPRRRHRRRRPDRLLPALPHRLRLDARARPAGHPAAARDHAALDGLGASVMELEDCAFPLLAGMVQTDDADEAFGDVDVALLVGAMPRKEGMERGRPAQRQRRHLQAAGRGALARSAQRDVQGARRRQPGQHQLPHRPAATPRTSTRSRFTAMTRLDHNRAIAQLAAKAGVARHRRHQDDDLGQPLGHPVPRRLPRRGRRRAGVRGRRRRPGVAGGRLHPHRAAARRRDHQGPRPLVGGLGRQRRRRPRALAGSSARPRATGCRWAS